MSFTQEELEKMKNAELRELLRERTSAISGTKSEMVERIIRYQEKCNAELDARKALLEKGAAKQDKEFETVIAKFQNWCTLNNYQLEKEGDDELRFEIMDINEVRKTFMDYDYTASPLRKDNLVPVPQNKTEEFLEMFFGKLGSEWFMFYVGEGIKEVSFEQDQAFRRLINYMHLENIKKE